MLINQLYVVQINQYYFVFLCQCRGSVFNLQHPIAAVFLLFLVGLLQQLPESVHLRQHQPRIQTGIL
jgi:hypothetical protein